MSGANAISGIALVGALTLAQDTQLQTALAFCNTFASINVFEWLFGNQSNVKMFKKK